MSLIQLNDVLKIYTSKAGDVTAVDHVSLSIEAGEFTAIVGPSGCGKTTLLNAIGGLDRPDKGSIRIGHSDITGMSDKALIDFRLNNIGFVFQDFNLIPVLTVFENVEYPLLMVQNWPKDERRKRVLELLDAVGMADQVNKYPSQISGGQKQRVAVARALVTNAKLVLADEPTANLDRETANRIINLMKRMRDEFQTTFIFSTHDPKIVQNVEITFALEDGRFTNSDNSGGGSHV